MGIVQMLVRFISILCTLPFLAAETSEPSVPQLFGGSNDHPTYFHSHTASPKELAKAAIVCPIFEIDLAWAHSSFHPLVVKGTPYIGHPEEFYTKMGKPFPVDNVTLAEFQHFLRENPSVRVLLDIKDATTFPYLIEFVKVVGTERCIIHAFIKNWTLIPAGTNQEPHWYREDVDLFALDAILSPLGVPLIANCRGFSDQNVGDNGLIFKMIEDAKRCKSVVCLGLYYPGAPLPNLTFLQLINGAGYYAWVNGNVDQFQEKIGRVRTIAMSDDLQQCNSYSK